MKNDTLFHIEWGDNDHSFILAPDKETAIERMSEGKDMVRSVVELAQLYKLIFEAGARSKEMTDELLSPEELLKEHPWLSPDAHGDTCFACMTKTCKAQLAKSMDTEVCPECHGKGKQAYAGTSVPIYVGECIICHGSGRVANVGEIRSSPTIICLCGSTRFVDTFNEWQQRLTLEGKIVLSIELVLPQTEREDPQHSNFKVKRSLDELHLRKIDLADEVMILNVGGYIGESTRNELNYAMKLGKPIIYLEGKE